MSKLTITSAATYRNIITPAEARTQLGTLLVDVSDDLLTAWVGQITALVENALRRVLPQERVVETFQVPNWREFALSRYPVATLHDVTVNDIELAATDYTLVSPDAGIVRLLTAMPLAGMTYEGIGLYTAGQRQTVVIDYTAGYGMAGSTGVEPAVPTALKLVCFNAIQAQVFAAGRDPTVVSERLGDASRTYAASGGVTRTPAAAVITAALGDVLAPYARHAL